MEQLAARWAHNPKVTGSSPVPATRKKPLIISGFFRFDEIGQIRFAGVAQQRRLYRHLQQEAPPMPELRR